jgi:hypothetical protein
MNQGSAADLIQSSVMVEAALAHILNAEGEKIQKTVALAKNVDELLEVNRSVNKTIISAIQLEQANYQRLDALLELYRSGNDVQPPVKPRPDWPDHPPDFPIRPDYPIHPVHPIRHDYPDYPHVQPEPEWPRRPGYRHIRSKPDIPKPEPSSYPEYFYDEVAPALCVTEFNAATEYQWTGGSTLYVEQQSSCNDKISVSRRGGDTSIILPPGTTFKIEYELVLNIGARSLSALK